MEDIKTLTQQDLFNILESFNKATKELDSKVVSTKAEDLKSFLESELRRTEETKNLVLNNIKARGNDVIDEDKLSNLTDFIEKIREEQKNKKEDE